jgi:protoporphyrinogen oxidase
VKVAVVGAGPAGLTTAYQLAGRDVEVVVFEAADVVGGISRTVEHQGYRFDLGGHRFFSRSAEVEALWDEMADEPLLVRPRLSRIFYGGRFYDYPLRLGNVVRNLGPRASAAAVLSYAHARVSPPPDDGSLESWVTRRFGRRLYETFFRSYTEKVWGMPCSQISAEWAAQRIRGLSLSQALAGALLPSRRRRVTTLIDRFRYPSLGPGQLWESCAARAQEKGAEIRLGERVVGFEGADGAVGAVRTLCSDGGERVCEVDHVLSSMALSDLVPAIPWAPPAVRDSAARLRYRGLVLVVAVYDACDLFPDNWVYVHSPAVQVGRVQNFGNWSAAMVPDPRTSCLGMEYFADPGDELWSQPDDRLLERAVSEVADIGLVRRGRFVTGTVVRVPGAYPVYSRRHETEFAPLRDWLRSLAGLTCIGRSGQHRYNNMDHSMMTALLAVRNLVDGGRFDVWDVNADAEYHEEGPEA